MNRLAWISVALAVGCCGAVGRADDVNAPKSAACDVDWQWEGDRLPPRLRITIVNRAGAPVELKNWKLSGAGVDQFAFATKGGPPPASLGPGSSVDVRLVWNRKESPAKKSDAALRFDHNMPGVPSPQIIALGRPMAQLPGKLRFDGFLARQGRPVPRDAEGRIVTDDGYHDGPMIERLLAAFAEDYPHIVKTEAIGTTWQGRKLLALRIGGGTKPPRDKPAFLFVAAHHAAELLSTEIVLDIIQRLTAGYATDPEIRRWVDDYAIWCLPLANPDGLHNFFHVNGAGRKNGRDTNANGRVDFHDGVDLNRNYPFRWHTLGEKGSSGDPAHGRYRGPEAASEPETKALMALADRERFAMLISYHTSGTRVLVPYTIDGARNPHPDAAWILGATMAALAEPGRADRDYLPVRNLYSVDGVDQDWHYWRHGTLAFLWEGPMSWPPLDVRKKMIAGARPGWEFLLRRLATGPTVSGHVFDAATGQPLEAAVSIDEIKTFEGEQHTSHPVSGRFDRVLPIEGAYHLRVEKDGYCPAVVELTVDREWRHVRVNLARSGPSR